MTLGKVNIIIKTKLAGIKAKNGSYEVTLEYELKSGEKASLVLAGEVTNELPTITKNELTLTAQNVAFCRMTKTGCDIEIFTDNKNVISGWNCGWIHRWNASDWKNAKGEDVAHVQLWKSIYKQLKYNKVTFTYREWEPHGNKGKYKKH